MVTWKGLKVHRVRFRPSWADVAITVCGRTIDDAEQLIRAAGLLVSPKACRNCDRSER